MNRPRYTPTEDRLLIRYFRTRGLPYCAKRLATRTPSSVANRAMRLGLVFADLSGYVTVGMVSQATGLDTRCVAAYAKQNGVLKTVENASGRKRQLVPEAWADAFVADSNRRTDAEEDRDRGLIDAAALAGRFRVDLDTVYRGFKGRGRLRALKDLPHELGRRNNRLVKLEALEASVSKGLLR